MTHKPPAPTKQRVVRIWPSSKQDQYRLEYDPQPDGTFFGVWVTRRYLYTSLYELLPGLSRDDFEEINHALLNLQAQYADYWTRFIEVTRELPTTQDLSPQTSTPEISTEITDFHW